MPYINCNEAADDNATTACANTTMNVIYTYHVCAARADPADIAQYSLPVW